MQGFKQRFQNGFDCQGLWVEVEVEKELGLKSKKDIENLVMGIMCSELSKEFGNIGPVAYQVMARQYYDLQNLLEKGDEENIKSVISDSINKFERVGYKGMLKNIKTLLENSEKKSSQLIALRRAYANFKLANKLDDTRKQNKSSRGMCLVDIVRISNHAEKINRNITENRLREAKGLLEECITSDSDPKGYRRLAEAEFRLANTIKNEKEKEELYKLSINHHTEAAHRLNLLGEKINSEIYALIGSSYYKLRQFDKAIVFFNMAKKKDNSAELLSKIGNSYLHILDNELSKEKIKKKTIEQLIGQTKSCLENALKEDEKNGRDHLYPYFLLNLLSSKLKDKREEYGLASPERYLSQFIEKYNESSRSWRVKKIGESINYVYESLDDYGLFENLFVFKTGRKEKLEREVEITKSLNKKLISSGKSKEYQLPESIEIFEHKDEAKKELSGWNYAMLRKQGKSLESILKYKKIPGLISKVIDYLAFIHANVDTSTLMHKDYSVTISEKLEKLSSYGKIDRSLTEKIANNYEPILKSFEGATLAYHKDAHLENWIINSENICAIDFEDRGQAPLEFDLVNLMERGSFFSDEEKNEHIKSYEDSLKNYKNNFQFSKLRYLNAVVHRGIAFIASWSEKESLAPKRKIILGNILHSLDLIEKENPFYYETYKN